MKFVAMITRTLKPGKTYEDYRKAWFHSKGFGVPTAMYTVVNMANPREIISIGIIDCDLEQLNKGLQIEVEDRLNHPLEDVIESTIVRNFGVVAAVDDFSAEGDLTYVQPQVDGRLTDFNQLPLVLESIANEIRKASFERDRLRKERGKYLVSTIDDRPQTEYEIKLLRQSKKEACSNQVFYNGTCYTSPHKKPRLPNGADKIISEDGA